MFQCSRITLLLASLIFSLAPLFTAEASSGGSKEAAGTGPFYFKLSPGLIANLSTNGKMVRCDIELMTTEAGSLPDIQLHAPALRHELLMLLSDQDGAKIKTPDGREQLRKDALEAMRKVMKELAGKKSVDDLFFTSFFVQ